MASIFDYNNNNQYNDFNRFSNLDGIEYKMVYELLHSKSKYAENIWKLLYYTTPDALMQDNLTYEQKSALICGENNTGETLNKRVFITPYIDDAWTEQTAHIHIYVDALHSPNHIVSNVHVSIETIVHAKVGTILSDVNEADANPNDSDINGEPVVLRKNRATVLLKNVLALFNGMNLDGIGQLQFNQSIDPYCVSTQYLWNSRVYYGHLTRMVVKMASASSSPNRGY